MGKWGKSGGWIVSFLMENNFSGRRGRESLYWKQNFGKTNGSKCEAGALKNQLIIVGQKNYLHRSVYYAFFIWRLSWQLSYWLLFKYCCYQHLHFIAAFTPYLHDKVWLLVTENSSHIGGKITHQDTWIFLDVLSHCKWKFLLKSTLMLLKQSKIIGKKISIHKKFFIHSVSRVLLMSIFKVNIRIET